jgi:uncharacterized protein YecE (DUF72 family)
MARSHSDDTLSLFGDGDERRTPQESEYIRRNRERVRRWTSKGILFGSSSWKYPGWKGTVYTREYPSKKAFNQECLAEYSTLFPTVCADFALYDFPRAGSMQVIHDTTTDEFRLSLKVTDRITIKRYPQLPRFGPLAGTENPDFLNVELFEDAFLKPVEQLRKKRGVIIFEFSSFHPASGIDLPRFIDLMEDFLHRLPRGFEYAVEIRNREFLADQYLAMLSRHGVAHVLNNWTHMPPILEQISIAGALSAPFSVARALLKPGRTYQQAVDLFEPYEEIREPNPELREGIVGSVARCIAEGRTLYAYVNNRAEGNSPRTIEAILDILDSYPVEKL